MKPRACLYLPWMLLACHTAPGPDDTDVGVVDTDVVGVWNPRMPEAAQAFDAPRGFVARRAVFHLHSPYSHDACDGAGWVNGVMDTTCEADLRRALCTDRYDVAFVTDHPDYGDQQPWEALFHVHPGDELIRGEGDDILANKITCDDGHVVLWRQGFEDELMPVGMRHQIVAPTQEERHTIMNASDASAVAAMIEAGGTVMIAHTESKDPQHLAELQDAGLHAVEAFNVHAMFAPNIRGDFLGLDPLGFLADLGPFTSSSSDAQPDLLFLAVHVQQDVSVAKWDALLQRGPMMATAGADTHQNVLPAILSDGERVDSYRRGLRWFTTVLLAKSDSLADVDEAVASRRAFIAFEILGTPRGFDFHLETDAGVVEMGGDSAATGKLVVTCPTLASGSPRGEGKPDISVIVYKDGQEFQQGCGEWPVERGVYRVRVDMVPNHLTEFLGSVPTNLIKSYPWIYSGAIRVAME